MKNENQSPQITITTVDELVNHIVKVEKFKSGIAYVAGAIDALNCISSIYYDDMKKSDVIIDLHRCVERKGIQKSIDRIKNFATGHYKNLTTNNI